MCEYVIYPTIINGIPARVLKGDTLTQKFTDCFHTPMWVFGGFNYKYERWKVS